MTRNYRQDKPNKNIILFGDNFITKRLFSLFKRYSFLKVKVTNNIENLNKCNFIIDCSFDEKIQNKIIGISIKNKIDKLIILNHWGRNLPNNIIPITQLVLPDVYGEGHSSFTRMGVGNSEEYEIEYNNLICESIRRIHESKIGGLPFTYIDYSESSTKYIYIDNIYEVILGVLEDDKSLLVYDVHDGEKTSGNILRIIQEVVDYNGEVIFNKTSSLPNKNHKVLKTKNDYLENNIRKIYKYLLNNNDRFKQ